MNARKALLSATALLALTLASCGTINRAGKDIFLGVGTPILMLYGGATDGFSSAKSIRGGMDSGGAVEVFAFPFTFAYYAAEHGVYGLAHIADLALCPFYAAAELNQNGQPVMPLDIYTGTGFDTWAAKRYGTDPESGEVTNR